MKEYEGREQEGKRKKGREGRRKGIKQFLCKKGILRLYKCL